jgi:hypothetical protein
MPDPLPVVVLDLIGARALLVYTIDEQAAMFYRSLGFRPSPLSASTLMLQLSEPVGRQLDCCRSSRTSSNTSPVFSVLLGHCLIAWNPAE